MRIARYGLVLGLALLVFLDRGAKLCAQDSDTAPDVLLFADGDKLSGTVKRIEHGSVVFQTSKAGELRVGFGEITDLRCPRLFAVIPEKVKVSEQNAVVGTLELVGTHLVVTPAKGPPVKFETSNVAFAVDEKTFHRELVRKVPLTEGWDITLTLGAGYQDATQHATTFNTEGIFERVVPGVDYLPRRNRTRFEFRDSAESVTTPNAFDGQSYDSHTHTLHGEAERDEYLHSRFYALANYSIDQDLAQGLKSQELIGGGIGCTAVKDDQQQLDIKVDFHREKQAFTVESGDDSLMGHKFVLDYERSLPRSFRLQSHAEYLMSYNYAGRYSANGNAVLILPVWWRMGISFTVTDNYLNNAVPGDKQNSLRFETSLTYRSR